MRVQSLLRSFAGGEIAPELYGRLDLDKYQTGLQKALNFVILPHGPAATRPGFAYVNEVKDSTKAVRLIPFQYSADQSMVLEFGDQYIRFHTGGGTLLEGGKNITGITQPAGVVTVTAHGWSNGDWLYLSGIGGMTELNGRFVVVSDAAADTFRMKDFAGNYITTGDYTAYTSGGTAARVYEIASPYLEADLFDLHYTQNADILTIVHPSYEPRELSRLGAVNWSLAEITFDSVIDPPATCTAAATVGTGSVQYSYAVSSVDSTGIQESEVQASAGGSTTNITGVSIGTETTWVGRFVSVFSYGIIDVVSTAGIKAGDIIGPIASVTGITGINGNTYKVRKVASATRLHVVRANGAQITSKQWSGTYSSGGTVTFGALLNDLTTAGNYNTVSWPQASGAARYRVYKKDYNSGLYGYIGETESTEFKDDNIIPDTTKTPPENIDPFTGADNYPAAVGYFEQRRVFGGTTNGPQYVWLTRTGAESNFSASFPALDADAFSFRIASRQNNQIRHIMPLADLLVFTPGAEFRVDTPNREPVTPSNVNPRPQSYVGASNVQPASTQASVLYAQDVGGHVRELSYSWEAQTYTSNDMSLLAPHLFDGYEVKELAFQRGSAPVLWVVRSDGKMLGFTYVPDQRVVAWHQHDTDGLFESACAVAESGKDRLYVVASRTIDGRAVRYIERAASRDWTAQEDAFCVDSGLTYDGAATTTITGLWHLEGEAVAVTADGAVVDGLTVSGGSITLDSEAQVVHVGLPYTCDLQTLPLSMEGAPAAGAAIRKNIVKAWLRVYRSSGIFAGPAFDALREYQQRTDEPYDTAPELKSEMIEIPVIGDWNLDGSLCIRQSDPLPLTVLSMVLDVAVGG